MGDFGRLRSSCFVRCDDTKHDVDNVNNSNHITTTTTITCAISSTASPLTSLAAGLGPKLSWDLTFATVCRCHTNL
jgi:hypothetical protein